MKKSVTNGKRNALLIASFIITILLSTILLFISRGAKNNTNVTTPTIKDTTSRDVEQEPIYISSITEDIIRNRWVSQEICVPPCWEGILPGDMVESVLDQLQSLEFVTDIKVHEYPNIGTGEIEWSLIENPGKGGRLFFRYENNLDDGQIYEIWPDIGCCIALGDVIRSFGEPEYVLVSEVYLSESPTPQQMISSYSMIWIKQGFMVEGYPNYQTQIDKEFQVHTVIFFYPDWDGYLTVQGNSGAKAIPWHGFDDGLNYLVP